MTLSGVVWGGYLLWISLIIIATLIIWRAGDFFSPAATYIQKDMIFHNQLKPQSLTQSQVRFRSFV